MGLVKLTVACICVEMNVQEKMPKKFWIDPPKRKGYFQPLKYSYFAFCSHCAHIGHSLENYRKNDRSP